MDALLDLGPVPGSKKGQWTPEEVNLLHSWKAPARRDFYVGGLVGSVASWLVMKRLPQKPRLLLSAGTGVVFGLTLLVRSANSSLDYMLSLHGTRVQRELVLRMLNRHQNDPRVHQRISKYFYAEVVYNDSSVDKALYRWRYRNSSGDLITPQTQGSPETNSNENDVKMTAKETKQVYASAGGNTVENPFDLIFGLPESIEEVPDQPDAPRILSRRQTRREKRLHHRRRHVRHEESEI
ncbi:uncharacterized protein LOC131001167 [Salvia miltiorrhiza]|uniref:uncharacterized protein LOC131001167 n=1 Tax=Salvia miltiorrhiza TaxID=226208 RepID=UPI0025ABAD87|nr:uncharacterized protein LOC131001167 [Salvia miltiorrhiza]XP_057783462.1 uncharacterized protein LOC131001167 [Salvia miltiorrhiza]XP_057783464.1 uncharacterized protein LOC131001167 [Salvia miltiorrhiza]